MMYLEHFGLREAPFRLTPLTDFFFSGARRGATAEALIYAILHDEGIVKVSGEVGAGKTMLCRVLIERLPDTVDTVYFANPTLDPDALLRTVANELGLSLPADDRVTVLGAITDELIARHGAGRRVVALVDEAHAMPAASLEQIRLLSNLETGRHKLLQIVLFGQPELDAQLEAHAMRPLKDRITHHFRLAPFAPDEVADYVDFRMRAAGYRGPKVFSPAATRRIAAFAAGLTRRINVLADKALLAAYAQNMHAVNPAHVKTAARDAQYLPGRSRRPGWLVIPTLLVIAAVLAWQAIDRQARAPSASSGAAPATPSVTEARPSPPEPAPRPTQPAPVSTPVEEPHVAAPKTAPQASGGSAQGTPPADAAPAGIEGNPTPGVTATPTDTGFPLAAAARAAQLRWMREADDATWFIQLHTNLDVAEATLEQQVARARDALPDASIRVYEADLPGGHRTGVIMGSYASEGDAMQALKMLPARYRGGGAYIRQARWLK
ncbi:ExeA family protein [Nitrogeniibacter mangrovi]|uniref:ExeA family protein n=1 Tax=Nitrogeniibacter mangrovi TaxID=2016596 RepID=UPI001C2D60B5|nr:AAA family ATPase [Nitrogeniibacter mangrovi]